MTANKTGTAAAYAYDPLGRRTKKTVNSASTFFLQDGDDEVGEYTAAGAIQRRFVPGDTIDEPISMIDYTIAGNPKTYFHTDKQGSTIAMTDASGNLAEGPYKYDGYGNGAPTTGVPFKYTGRRLDPETGLYYYRARYYSASLGRFLQTDPIRYGDDLVMYKYAANDPLNNLDPSGQDFCTTTPPIRCFASPTETVTVYGSSLDADVAFVARMGAISDALEAGMLSRMAAALAEYAPPTAFIVATLYPSTTAGPEGDEYPMGLYNDKVDIDDPESVKGANPEEIAESAKEKGYVESPTRKPGGRRFTSPNGSDQVRIMPGQPGRRSDPVKEGPYAVISKNGKITNVPLAGNPTL